MENTERKKGVYETVYGNAAYVSGPKAKSAWDLDMAERIPITAVTMKWIRKAEAGEGGRRRVSRGGAYRFW